MKYKIINIPDATAIPVPRNLTPHEEAEVIAQYKSQVDLGQLEADCRELLKEWKDGKTVSLEQVLSEIEGPSEESKKESA